MRTHHGDNPGVLARGYKLFFLTFARIALQRVSGLYQKHAQRLADCGRLVATATPDRIEAFNTLEGGLCDNGDVHAPQGQAINKSVLKPCCLTQRMFAKGA
jgi:hypothetical protein